LEFPVVYASGRDGTAGLDYNNLSTDIRPLLDAIIKEIPAPEGDAEKPLQILVSNVEYDEYVGRIGVGRVERGSVTVGQNITLIHQDGTKHNAKIGRLYTFEGLRRADAQSASVGDLVAISGIEGINIGETICDVTCPEPLPFVKIDEPTISMNFIVNDSPFAGKEGKYVTSRNLRDRLMKEIETNISLRVEETDSSDTFKVSGRGELHLSILIETMRRQNYEFQISRPKVIFSRDEDGTLLEPMELLMIETPESYVGTVMEKLGNRKAELIDMTTRDGGMTHIEFKIPSRCLMGYRSQFASDTNGNGIMNHIFDGYEPYKGDLETRQSGSIVVFETGESTAYGLFNTQDRGRLFIGAGVDVYEGMIVGESPRSEDLVCNVCKKKHLTNTRASGSDDALRLTPPVNLSLEQCMEFLKDDELLEVTPTSLRLRKTILNKEQRLKAASRKGQ
ncbi:MAG: translational GTPase TypA, partial [Clostridia bacterium]|nr:translational GTPase TypA [Clostridia bacterium]